MAELGRVALLIALAAAGWALLAGFAGAFGDRRRSTRNAELAIVVAAVAITTSSGALIVALLTRDFGIEYVAQYTSRSLSVFYTLGAFWAGQAGSLLLWAWVLAICSAIVVAQRRTRDRALMPWAITVLAGILLFFLVLVTFYADPFARLAVAPPDGQGLNPLLQNYGQWIHPLALYIGFVGFSVPFAFGIAALITGELGDRWLLGVRRWSLWSWILLTAGILLGARWAYVELGWGGYWAWDPVENASLLPWLTATIFLHSATVQEKRGVMKTWNVTLLPATFALSIFGTFLTRSGVVSSVHAFAESTMGPLLLGFTGLVVLVSAGLIVWRLPRLGAAGRFGSAISRESSFLATGVLFTAMTMVVFWGTVYPLVAEAVDGTKVSVGPSFFQSFMVPLSILLLALVGICPLLAWRRTDAAHLWSGLTWPLAIGGSVLALGLIASGGRHVLLALVTGLGAFALTTVVGEIARGLRARRSIHGERWTTAVHHLFALTPRRYGGPIAHAGMIVLLTAIALNLSMKEHTQTTLAIDRSARVGGYELTLRSLTPRQEGSRFATVATFDVRSGGSPDGTITAELVQFDNQQTAADIGIRSTLGADLYVVLGQADQARGLANIDLYVEPGMLLIWIGMVIVVLGGVLAGWPKRPNMLTHDLEMDAVSGTRPANELVMVGAPATSDDFDRELERQIAAHRKALRERAPHRGGDGM
ncbi:MAG: heme lyase CcmF/NrfE family subunit [Actinomycetota bacterium]